MGAPHFIHDGALSLICAEHSGHEIRAILFACWVNTLGRNSARCSSDLTTTFCVKKPPRVGGYGLVVMVDSKVPAVGDTGSRRPVLCGGWLLLRDSREDNRAV